MRQNPYTITLIGKQAHAKYSEDRERAWHSGMELPIPKTTEIVTTSKGAFYTLHFRSLIEKTALKVFLSTVGFSINGDDEVRVKNH